MRAEVQAFAKAVPSGKKFILLCKCPLNSYLYCNISVERVSNRTSFSYKTLAPIAADITLRQKT
jgi:hypothetical protein